MNSVFSNAILAFLESEKTGTLADLRKFLVDESYRRSFLENVTDPSIVYYWKKEFPILKSSSIGPILTRLDTFLRPKLIRHMVVQKDSLDFEKILNGNKIVLVKLSQGLIGIENSYLLGSFIVSKIHQTALGRQQMKVEVRKPYFLYIDEFQHFITPSMVSILSGARKYGLGMVLAHQDLTQIQKSEGEIYSALFSNIGTRICFRVGEQDARKLEEGLEFFTAKDLLNLGKGQAIVRSDKAENDFNIFTPRPAELPDVNFKDDVINYSRAHYATSLKEVEIALREVFESESQIKEPISNKREPKQEKKIVEEVEVYEKILPEFRSEVIEVLPQVSNHEKSLHRYTQTLIKKMAESRGFKATIEKQLENGVRVDVSLESNGFLIGCEICNTTTKEWELHNIMKCLESGYNIVISCSTETKILGKIKKLATESLDKDLLEKIMFLEPTDLVAYLDSIISQETSTEKRIKGYRVKVNYENISDQEIKNKREAITKVVVDSIRKMNKKL
jgi:TraM recognition site of TraD and TraG